MKVVVVVDAVDGGNENDENVEDDVCVDQDVKNDFNAN